MVRSAREDTKAAPTQRRGSRVECTYLLPGVISCDLVRSRVVSSAPPLQHLEDCDSVDQKAARLATARIRLRRAAAKARLG